ncbi:Bgt-50540 [Blumeria graminis f. sp. tritici]|uniref:Bgt-50540 n=1 Tax=Blumeria graminis f. sp. tritici TaxID=62690 RepID=A0A9X9MHW0_BLUGR|nr:Bgt-50540 [Blumeria graminis f. sp. tritici]
MLEHQITIFLLRNVRTLLVTHFLECLPSSTCDGNRAGDE